MAIYKSGEAIVKFSLLKTTDTRKLYNFIVNIQGNEDFVFNGEDYSCPISWSDEQIASDMFNWALDMSMEGDLDLLNAIAFNEYVGNENTPLVEQI